MKKQAGAGDPGFEAAGILDSIDAGVTVQDLNGELVYANDAAARSMGLDHAEDLLQLGRDRAIAPFQIFDQDHNPFPLDRLPGRMVLHGADASEELLCFLRAGVPGERWSVVRARPLRNAEGRVTHAVNIWHDVTERVVNERAARDDAVRLRFLSEAGRILASSLDYETTLRSVAALVVENLAEWCTIHVVDNAGQVVQLEVAHSDPARIAFARELEERYPADRNAPRGVFQVIRTGQPELYSRIDPQLIEQAATDAEHRRMLLELNLGSAMIVPLLTHGRVLGAITMLTSAQSGREYTTTDLEFAEELARRAALAIVNAELYAASQDANRVKADFLAVMSHELRTPLTAILGYTELLDGGVVGQLEEKQRHHLGRIRASAWHLLQIIEEILSFARLEAGRTEIRPEPVFPKDIINDAAALVQPAVTEKGLTLTVEVQTSAPVLLDRGKVRQILVNLLSNAVKFTERGEIRLTFSRDGSSLIFIVADTGVGIRAEDLDSIFEPFRQLEHATTRSSGGTGLGLTVTRRLTELLGGRIAVTSTPGQGTTFTITLPAVAAR